MNTARVRAFCAALFVVGIFVSIAARTANAQFTKGNGCATTRPTWPSGDNGSWPWKNPTPTTRPDSGSWPHDHKWTFDLIGPGDCSGGHPTTRPDCTDLGNPGDTTGNSDWWKSFTNKNCSDSTGTPSDSQSGNPPSSCGTSPGNNNDSSVTSLTSCETPIDATSGSCQITSGQSYSSGDDSTSSDPGTHDCQCAPGGNGDPASVPEPASVGLIAAVGTAMLARRRRGR